VINSVFDTVSMLIGFVLAWRLPVGITVALAVIVEIALRYLIHDNFTLNIVMSVHPIEAVKAWQASAPLH